MMHTRSIPLLLIATVLGACSDVDTTSTYRVSVEKAEITKQPGTDPAAVQGIPVQGAILVIPPE